MVDHNQNAKLLAELQVTLDELAKAADNIVYIQQTMQSLGLFQLFQSKKNVAKLISSVSILEQLKQIDFDQIKNLLESPMIRRILSDPEFYRLFSPDTGTTPGTQPEWKQPNKD